MTENIVRSTTAGLAQLQTEADEEDNELHE